MTLLGRVGERRRIRVLAGDARAGSWARGRARTAQRDYLRRNWALYLGAIVVLVMLTAAGAALMPTSFLKGLVVGGFLVGGAAALWALIVQVTGTAPTMMGDTAEMWTASELRRLQGRGWRIVNHFILANEDVDHVLVGPGGAYAVETKWSASSWQSEFGRSRTREAVAQAARNARSLGLWHPMKSRGIAVQSVVVLWGAGANRREDIEDIEGVPVVTGQSLRTWTNSLGAGVLTAGQVAEIWTVLEEQVARRDPIDRAEHPIPPSVADLLVRCALTLGSAVLGMLAVGQLLALTGSVWLAVGIGACLMVPGLWGIRVGLLRWVSWGWSIGAGLSVLALGLAEVLDWLAA